MTTAEPIPVANPCDQQLSQLRTRYSHIRPAVLAALAIPLSQRVARWPWS